MLAIICPGQGAQTPGFLSDWAEEADNRTLLQEFGDIVQLDLLQHGTTSGEETIKDTAISQPLIVSSGLLAFDALKRHAAIRPEIGYPRLSSGLLFAGHSVGEVTASAISGTLTARDALKFIALRARGMAAASAETPTGMAAVLGGDRKEVVTAIENAGAVAANINNAQQVVASGSKESLKNLADNPPAKAKIIALKVSGAFHTQYMASAQKPLRRLAATLSTADPVAPLVSNYDGRLLDNGRAILDSLVSQVTRPVQWQACMERMVSAGVTGVLELPPAGTLVGLAKRAMPGAATFALKSPEQLDDARRFIQEHCRVLQGRSYD